MGTYRGRVKGRGGRKRRRGEEERRKRERETRDETAHLWHVHAA